MRAVYCAYAYVYAPNEEKVRLKRIYRYRYPGYK